MSQSLEEFRDETQLKGELEELDNQHRNIYEPFIKYVGDEGLRRMFSKNILWKDEGLDLFNKTVPKIFEDNINNSKEISNLINLTMKMLNSFLSEKHPQVSIRSIEIFETLLNQIKQSKASLNYDLTITDRILLKIKEKVGDVNTKLRNRAVDLYGYMLKQDFCDYNNLVSELVEDEIKHKITRSSKMILGKLSIFQNVFNDFDNAIKEKRTDMNSFPFIFVSTYVIENICNSKSEVRKLARTVLILMYKLFNYKKLEPLLKKVEERELEKLVPDIPEIALFLKQLNNNNLSMVNNNKIKRGRSSSRDKSKEKNEKNEKSENKNTNKQQNKSPSPLPTSPPSPKPPSCSHCGKSNKKFSDEKEIDDHISKDCVMFTNCVKCKINIEVKIYNNHLLNECANKSEFKMCKRCKEAIDAKEYDSHVKENKCNPAKNINSSNRCPLCHKDIPPQDKGFVQHLVKDICQKQKRRETVAFVNGK